MTDQRHEASMLKEELGMGECSSHLASSKNAKEKSNRLTLKAMRKNKDSDDCSERGSRCSSEKDSGYSDNAADWQQTDADQQSNKHQAREAGVVLGFGQSQDCGKGKAGDTKWMPRGQAIQPIYILNHRALKQTEAIPKSGWRFWNKSSSDVAGSEGAHRIFFQQPSLMPAALQIHKPLSQKNSTSGNKVTPYLPILDSYPRIAPHPNKKPPDKSVLSDGVQNFSKSVCTEQKVDLEPVARSQQPAISTLRQPASSSSSPTREPSNSAHRSAPTSALTNGGPQRTNRHRRFFNTADILRQSGLLDITLRTKELLRQSNATEREIAELRWHTELLCQAACSSPNGTSTWQRVDRTMANSNRYSDMQHLRLPAHRESAGRLVSAANEASQRRDPSARLSETQRQNCARVEPRQEFLSRETSPEKVTFVPPDSSTG